MVFSSLVCIGKQMWLKCKHLHASPSARPPLDQTPNVIGEFFPRHTQQETFLLYHLRRYFQLIRRERMGVSYSAFVLDSGRCCPWISIAIRRCVSLYFFLTRALVDVWILLLHRNPSSELNVLIRFILNLGRPAAGRVETQNFYLPWTTKKETRL